MSRLLCRGLVLGLGFAGPAGRSSRGRAHLRVHVPVACPGDVYPSNLRSVTPHYFKYYGFPGSIVLLLNGLKPLLPSLYAKGLLLSQFFNDEFLSFFFLFSVFRGRERASTLNLTVPGGSISFGGCLGAVRCVQSPSGRAEGGLEIREAQTTELACEGPRCVSFPPLLPSLPPSGLGSPKSTQIGL